MTDKEELLECVRGAFLLIHPTDAFMLVGGDSHYAQCFDVVSQTLSYLRAHEKDVVLTKEIFQEIYNAGKNYQDAADYYDSDDEITVDDFRDAIIFEEALLKKYNLGESNE